MKSFLTKKPEALQMVFKKFKVPTFSQEEEELLRAYVTIYTPITEALDILEGENTLSAGFLLPTLHILKMKLSQLASDVSIKIGKPLITALLSGLNFRFKHDFDDRQLIIAAVIHPMFKLKWVPSDEKERYEKLLKEEFDVEREQNWGKNPLSQSTARHQQRYVNFFIKCYYIFSIFTFTASIHLAKKVTAATAIWRSQAKTVKMISSNAYVRRSNVMTKKFTNF